MTGGIITGIVALAVCSALGMLNYIDPTEHGGSVFLVVLGFILSVVAAVLVGILLKRFILVGLLALAFVGGYMAGMLLYNLIFIGFLQNDYALAGCTFGGALIAITIAYFWRAAIIIISTSLVGSYFFIRGISMFAGGFPNEVTLY